MDYKQVTQCRVCGSKRLTKYLDLGMMPLVNALETRYDAVSPKYPLEILLCESCSLSQLSIVVDPKVLYANYPYRSSISSTFKRHCRHLGEKLYAMFAQHESHRPKPAVLDIASNDCCLLREFREVGFIINGVEPSTNLMPTLDELIPVTNDFWSEKLAKSTSYVMDFITATNVFAHVDDLDDFVLGVKQALAPKGMFVVEVPYLKDMLTCGTFDTIYHEHLSYFTFRAMKTILERHGLTVFMVEQVPIHGGSLRVYASKHSYPVDKSVGDLIRFENLMGYGMPKGYVTFVEDIEDNKARLLKLMRAIKGKKVVAYGASAKGVVLLNYCGLTKDDVQIIVDETPDKQGKFSPGTGIQILHPNTMEAVHPDFILMLAWNFFEEIYEKTKHLESVHIVPLPSLRVVV